MSLGLNTRVPPSALIKIEEAPESGGSLRCAHSSLNESVCQEWVFTMHGRTLALSRTSRVSLNSSERSLGGGLETSCL